MQKSTDSASALVCRSLAADAQKAGEFGRENVSDLTKSL